MPDGDLPHCDELFMKFFDRWYDDDDRRRKGFKATCPDTFSGHFKKGAPASKLTPLSEETVAKVEAQVNRMVECAREDWANDFDSRDPVSIQGLEDFDRHYDASFVLKVIQRSDPEDFSNEYVVTCCTLGGVLGKVLKDLRPDFEWVWEWPYWESFLFDKATTDQFKVFHWAIKKMSGYGVDDGLVAKVRFAEQQPWKNQPGS